jgi:hypothetical protein
LAFFCNRRSTMPVSPLQLCFAANMRAVLPSYRETGRGEGG